MVVDLSKLSESELKALAFEQIMQRDESQNNLNILIAEINKRHELGKQELDVEEETDG